MKIAIYQINLDRDENGVAFESHEILTKRQGSTEVDASLYDRVYTGEVKADGLEDVYGIYNIDRPDDFRGRSLSVSDVVEVMESDEVSPGFYYCDAIGFKKISFDKSHAKEVSSTTIDVLMVEPGERAKPVKIGTSREQLQQAVGGGNIEVCYPFEEDVCIVCNDEGKFNGMSPCRALYNENHQIYDIIFGPFFLCSCQGESFGSLTEEQVERYTKRFGAPEKFLRVNGEIKAIPYVS